MMRLILVPPLCCALLLAAAAQNRMDEIWKLVQAGNVHDALEIARAEASEHPGDAAALHSLGRVLYLDGKLEEAVKALERCLELGPDQDWMTAWSHTVLGQAYLRLGKRDLAEKHLQEAIELDATQNATGAAKQTLAALRGEDPFGKGRLHGKLLPDFTFRGLAGETIRRDDFRGRPVLLRFGASW